MKKFLMIAMLLILSGIAQAECIYLNNPVECIAEAERGNPIAQFILGYMYETGDGVEQDHKQAVKWYHKAAEQGDTNAQYNLGLMYDDDSLAEAPNYVLAHMWLSIADLNGYQDALKKRDALASKMTATQIQESEKRAIEWMTEHP